jgi:hypothetical protein
VTPEQRDACNGVGANQVTALPMPDRFWAKTERVGECLLWRGAVNRNGYGSFMLDGTSQTASRVAYELANGLVPDGLFVLHKCDNPLCVEPGHLYAGTHAMNMKDKTERGRARGAIGVRNTKAKLSDSQAAAIRESCAPTRELALKFDVSYSTIQRIRSRKLWRHVA